MPRTLPAALQTVMDAVQYEAYLRVVVNASPNDTGAVTVQPTAFKLEDTRAQVTIPYSEDALKDEGYFRIVRGALINGTPSTISSSWFAFEGPIYDQKFITYTGTLLDRSYLTIAADSDYETVIETTLTGVGSDNHNLVPNYEGAAAWKAYQFYPDGRTIVMSPRNKLFTILQQKYLIFATDDGWDGSQSNVFFFVATQTRAQDYVVTDRLFTYNGKFENRKLIWRDEVNTVHTLGNSNAILHNLGYLESTADDPITIAGPTNNAIGTHTSKIPVHLKYRTGDQIEISYTDAPVIVRQRIKVTEVLDLKATPAWYQVLEVLQFFGTTEGGSMPSTIEAAAPYTPLVTGNFDGILSANDNNLQAAMETIDDHEHASSYTDEIIQDLVGAMFSGNTETGITATYQDSDGTIDLEVTGGSVSPALNIIMNRSFS